MFSYSNTLLPCPLLPTTPFYCYNLIKYVVQSLCYIPAGESNVLGEGGEDTELKQSREEPGDKQSPEKCKQTKQINIKLALAPKAT